MISILILLVLILILFCLISNLLTEVQKLKEQLDEAIEKNQLMKEKSDIIVDNNYSLIEDMDEYDQLIKNIKLVATNSPLNHEKIAIEKIKELIHDYQSEKSTQK